MHVDRESFGQLFLHGWLRVSDVEFDVVLTERNPAWNRHASVLARDAPPPSTVSIAENLDGDPKRTMVGRNICSSSFRRGRTQLKSVDFLDIRQLVWLENSPRAHNVGVLGAAGHCNRDTLSALAYANIGRLNHPLITNLRICIDQ